MFCDNELHIFLSTSHAVINYIKVELDMKTCNIKSIAHGVSQLICTSFIPLRLPVHVGTGSTIASELGVSLKALYDTQKSAVDFRQQILGLQILD